MLNSSIRPINETLLGDTTPGQSGPGSNGNKRILYIPQSSRTGASSSDCFVSYQDTRWLGEVKMQLAYSTALANLVRREY